MKGNIMNDKKTLKSKIKEFVADHPAEVFAGVVTATAIGLVVYAKKNAEYGARKAIEAHNEYAALANDFIAKAHEEGKAVFLLHDWSYLLVPSDTPTEWIKDITKL
ncbi:hypothetical protein GORDON_35 [Arthrobacter phage Gordon]|uniref:Uncharacterized protein n=1 Tax=Arthrobacter phage Gordon TaxID=1772298 RepID=A0A0U4JXX5_9CAUD|nr:hypothetical protein FDH69_gp35 [Arthrobacter phage Gordon]ALY09010.1 hypothetical protein GORDON_35 [Arthrobacter phage Gordon]